MSCYINAIKNYCNFSGRASRRDYWMFVLFNMIVTFVLSIADGIIGINILSGIYSLFILIPNLSIEFRRLHDIDKSAWWLLISFIPIVGAIVLLVFTVSAGTPGPNRFGEDPKAANI